MDIRDSTILHVTLSKLFPFVVMFSFYVFSYGANYPGGGFQAGVMFGTIIVVIEMVFEQRVYSDHLYSVIEFFGVLILALGLVGGFVMTGYGFGTLYRFVSRIHVFSNVLFWTLNLAIYLEVAGSIILIFRNFLEWGDEDADF